MLSSRFTVMAYSPLFLSVLWVVLFGLVVVFLPGPKMPAVPVYVFSGVLTTMWLWFMLRELSTKICVVKVNQHSVSVAGFYGLGPTRAHLFSTITKSYCERKEGDSTIQEYFYLLSGDRKVITLSELYHQNYRPLKQELKEKVRKAGRVSTTQKRF